MLGIVGIMVNKIDVVCFYRVFWLLRRILNKNVLSNCKVKESEGIFGKGNDNSVCRDFVVKGGGCCW